jgi:hypothetical protein
MKLASYLTNLTKTIYTSTNIFEGGTESGGGILKRQRLEHVQLDKPWTSEAKFCALK